MPRKVRLCPFPHINGYAPIFQSTILSEILAFALVVRKHFFRAQNEPILYFPEIQGLKISQR